MRRLRVLVYAVAGTAVALFGWCVLLVGGILYLVFGATDFPRLFFWVVVALSTPVFFIILYRYFDRAER
jgi:hypothetical protein